MSQKITAITMPKWGIEMTEGAITAWNLQPGQPVAKGDALLDVETEKIVNQVEAPGDGSLRRILAPVGESRPVGALIGVLAAPDVPESEIDAFVANFRGASVNFELDGSPAPIEQDSSEQRISPIARRLAERLGLDHAKIPGTGRNGRVSKEDVEAFAAKQQQPAAGAAIHREKLSPTRLTIARRLTEASQNIPHIRLDIDVTMDAALGRKDQLRSSGGPSVSLNDLLIRAAGLALMKHPQVNAQLDGDFMVRMPHADIAIAVATPNGLITPVLRQVELKSLAVIAEESAALIERAKNSSLSHADITGGSFTLSNLGMYGVRRFDAIINPPQVAILAIGAAADRAVVHKGTVRVARQMTFTLAADHRVVDGAVGALFLQSLRELIEDPTAL